MTSKKKHRPQLLSSTRPRTLKPLPSTSSRKTRDTIRAHHTLRKQLSTALANGDHAGAEELRVQIENDGGLRKYQQASIQGQSAQRGGDTSKVLMEWLSDAMQPRSENMKRSRKLRLLEVGALRSDNACSRSLVFDVERIDLNSQHPDIKEQDFMGRSMPSTADRHNAGFDLVSLSLVVNFVGNPTERGEMLRRVETFLRPSEDELSQVFPALFLVLPSACVANSRYLDEDRLEAIMQSLGYRKVKKKLSAKLVYYLWKHEKVVNEQSKPFKKEEVRTGTSRNNFAIVLL